jgi:magnesium transporter
MHADFARLQLGQTVGEALDWVRAHPPSGRIIYFYVVDKAEQLCGVVPARRLVLGSPETPLAEIMIRQVVAIPAGATVLDACEFFIQHRLPSAADFPGWVATWQRGFWRRSCPVFFRKS